MTTAPEPSDAECDAGISRVLAPWPNDFGPNLTRSIYRAGYAAGQAAADPVQVMRDAGKRWRDRWDAAPASVTSATEALVMGTTPTPSPAPTDDLVARLREASKHTEGYGPVPMLDEAADAIEARDQRIRELPSESSYECARAEAALAVTRAERDIFADWLVVGRDENERLWACVKAADAMRVDDDDDLVIDAYDAARAALKEPKL